MIIDNRPAVCYTGQVVAREGTEKTLRNGGERTLKTIQRDERVEWNCEDARERGARKRDGRTVRIL